MSEIVHIGKIGNYYDCLTVKSENEKHYWSIEDWDGHNWEEITKPLYLALLRFHTKGVNGS